MSVYVDNWQAQRGVMKMSHMVADTKEELLTMADRIGLPRKHLQVSGNGIVHFDVCAAKRHQAVLWGAIQVTPQELIRRYRRSNERRPRNI